MFEIRCRVSLKQLASTLTVLKDYTGENPTVIPVEDEKSIAAPKPVHRRSYKTGRKRPLVLGGRHRKGKGSQEIVAEVMAEAAAAGRSYISARDVRKTAQAKGYEKTSYFYGIKRMVKEGKLKPLPLLGDYEIVQAA